MSQTSYSTIAYIDTEGKLVEYEPCLSERDTIIIPTYLGYAEMMHMYQALEYDYYLLKEGDSIIVKYDLNDRPVLYSLVSENNTELYNLPYSIPGAIQHKGYYIETILSDYNFSRAFTYFSNRDRFMDPDLDAYLSPRYVNLDSLKIEYEKYKETFISSLDSLLQQRLIDSKYYDYYLHRSFPEYRYRPAEIVQSDSLLHYISNFIIAQEYCSGRNTLESFDMIANDTLATVLARNGILKRLINNILDGDGGWHVYSDDVVSHYLQKYKRITGDLMPEQVVGMRGISVDSSSYELPLETIKGQSTTLEDVLTESRGKLVYVDLWASWCAPCLAQIPFAKELHRRLSGYNIQFIYISVDTNHMNWERKVRENADVLKESYRITNPDAVFLKDIRLNSIPRYLIFDTYGSLIDPDAIRPSDETVFDKLIALLNEAEVNQ